MQQFGQQYVQQRVPLTENYAYPTRVADAQYVPSSTFDGIQKPVYTGVLGEEKRRFLVRIWTIYVIVNVIALVISNILSKPLGPTVLGFYTKNQSVFDYLLLANQLILLLIFVLVIFASHFVGRSPVNWITLVIVTISLTIILTFSQLGTNNSSAAGDLQVMDSNTAFGLQTSMAIVILALAIIHGDKFTYREGELWLAGWAVVSIVAGLLYIKFLNGRWINLNVSALLVTVVVTALVGLLQIKISRLLCNGQRWGITTHEHIPASINLFFDICALFAKDETYDH